MLEVAFQMDPLERINFASDSTFALMLEAFARGHRLWFYTPDQLTLEGGALTAPARAIAVRDEPGRYFELGEARAGDRLFECGLVPRRNRRLARRRTAAARGYTGAASGAVSRTSVKAMSLHAHLFAAFALKSLAIALPRSNSRFSIWTGTSHT